MNGAVSKTVVRLTAHRGFESLPLRYQPGARFCADHGSTGERTARMGRAALCSRVHGATGVRLGRASRKPQATRLLARVQATLTTRGASTSEVRPPSVGRSVDGPSGVVVPGRPRLSG